MGEAAADALAVRIEALVNRYGRVTALDGVALEIARRESFGLLGANGAGKTTLIRCLLDLTSADAGSIQIFGVPASAPASRRNLAYLPERFTPPHYLTGAEFLRTLAQLAGVGYDSGRVARLVDELELEREALERPVRNLSKGMTQKLGLAGCFSLEREMYVLDEPMSGLDPAARVAVKSVLQRLSAEGRTLFFTSHVLADVDELCSSIAVLDQARLRFRGAPQALCARYGESSLERAFMRCIRDDKSSVAA
jgi:ABC-2 type transport system ATP-binding protein